MGFKKLSKDVFSTEDKFTSNSGKFLDVKLQKFASESSHIKDDLDVLNLRDDEKKDSVYGNMSDKASTVFEISRKKNMSTIDIKKKDSKEKISVIRQGNDSRKEKSEKIKTEKKKLKKEISKDKKAAATKTAVSNMFKARKEMAKELEGSQVSGDAFKDGQSGLLKLMGRAVNPFTYLKKKIAKILAAFAPNLGLVVAAVMIIMLFLAMLFEVLAALSSISDSVDNYISNIVSVDTNERTNLALTNEQIGAIVAMANPSESKKKAIEFALSKVGYPYSQDLRCSGRAFDCSSLCYYSYLNAGKDFDPVSHYPPTAASLASQLNSQGKTLTIDSNLSLKAGDLIFYGGEANGRYLGIYHVALYIGGGKCVEALNTKCGVVYGTVRTKSIVMICRP